MSRIPNLKQNFENTLTNRDKCISNLISFPNGKNFRN